MFKESIEFVPEGFVGGFGNLKLGFVLSLLGLLVLDGLGKFGLETGCFLK